MQRVSLSEFPAQLASGNVSCDVFPGGEEIAIDHAPRLSSSLGGSRMRSLAARSYCAMPLTLHVVNDARVFKHARYFALPDLEVAPISMEHWKGDPLTERRMPLFQRYIRRHPPGETLSGPVFFARSMFEKNIYHWHHDLLPLVHHALEALPGVPFRVLIGGGTAFQEQSLAALDIPPERILTATPDAVAVERLICGTTTRTRGFSSPTHPTLRKVIARIKKHIPPPAGAERIKIFVSRGGSQRRLLRNRSEVEAAFARAGFFIADPGTLSYRDQIALFDSASAVVGEHGGGMFNIGFCRPGTPVVELFHPVHNDLCYYGLANLMGLPHGFFVGTAASDNPFEWNADPEAALRFAEAIFSGDAQATGGRAAPSSGVARSAAPVG